MDDILDFEIKKKILLIKEKSFRKIENVCKGFNIDNCKPTKTHLFMGFLCQKNIVRRIYTQNVDGLELKAGVPYDKMVFAHGKITEAACPLCRKEYDINSGREDDMKEKYALELWMDLFKEGMIDKLLNKLNKVNKVKEKNVRKLYSML